MAQPKRYGLPSADLRRVSASVRRFEGYYRLPPPAGPRGQAPSSERTVPVICPSGGITSGTQASPTHGTGHFSVPNGSGPALQAGDSVELYNTLGVAVPSGSTPGFATWFAGFWYLVSFGGC